MCYFITYPGWLRRGELTPAFGSSLARNDPEGHGQTEAGKRTYLLPSDEKNRDSYGTRLDPWVGSTGFKNLAGLVGSVRFGSVRFGWVRFGSVGFGWVRFGWVGFGWVGSVGVRLTL